MIDKVFYIIIRIIVVKYRKKNLVIYLDRKLLKVNVLK